ncbi:winged helix DNA-binding domain-containing protein [Agromyces atrinae]|uniref:winged helix-turn-helix domain-containing protein n=1 Tax=Agromyces atrinae TaxID=592376 RepID=UPI001F5743FE|nr:crosslink repair DNA glycosylase YcaQ family protein [Agromyces atrinae]MCI2959322.1 winged helix DNA-binding domain-containing protein [Agromyces atrinae]
MPSSLSLPQARRIALAAQGFGRPKPASTGIRALSGVVDRLGLLQIDSVNVFERSHYLPLLSRLGHYDRGDLDRLTYGRRGRMIESWAHQAAFVPREDWPLFAFRRDEFRAREAAPDSWSSAQRPLIEWLLAEVAAHGPLRASTIEHDANERRGAWWGWSDVKIALEKLWLQGDVVCVERTRFERVYALPEQVLTAAEAADAPVDESVQALVEHAARAFGVATEADLADYFRMKRAPVRRAIESLVDDGVLEPVTVDGWMTGTRPTPAWLHRDARRPRRIDTAALLSPFDPVVWFRPRNERLFDFHYRIEIYTPEPQRIFGYYSLPVLIDDDVVGRIDLKSDRKAGVLRVQSAWTEPNAPVDTAERILPALREAASWQGLDSITVSERGNLTPALASVVRAG